VSKSKKVVIIAVCVGIASVVTSVRYVHRGYVGVVECGDTLRLLDHGLHLKAPWSRLTFYPVRSTQIHLEASHEGPEGKVQFDIVVILSVRRDSIASLHETYRGAYVERLISPLVVDFLREHEKVSATWHDGTRREDIAKEIVERLNSTVAVYGINVYRAWLMSFEVVPGPEGKPQVLTR